MKELMRSCAGNYKNALKQLFTVLGILFLSLLLGFSAMLQQAKTSVVQLKTSVVKDYDEADLSLSYITDAVEQRIQEFGIGDLISIIEKKSLMPVLEGRIERALDRVLCNYESFAEKLQEDVAVCAAGLCLAVVFLAVILLLGLIVSFFTADITVRGRLSRENFFHVLLEMLVRFLGYAAAAAVAIGLYQLSPEHWELFACLLPFLLVLFGMLASWLTAKKYGVTLKSVMTPKNYFGLLLADLLMLAVSAALGWLLYRVFNIVIAAVVILSLAVVTLAALDLSTTGCIEEVKKLTAAGEQAELQEQQ